jgi:hypothetical protein
MRYANAGDYLHPHQARQRYVELPSELLDRNQDSDTVYLLLIQLTFGQSINRYRLLQNFDWKRL